MGVPCREGALFFFFFFLFFFSFFGAAGALGVVVSGRLLVVGVATFHLEIMLGGVSVVCCCLVFLPEI